MFYEKEVKNFQKVRARIHKLVKITTKALRKVDSFVVSCFECIENIVLKLNFYNHEIHALTLILIKYPITIMERRALNCSY